MDNNTNNNLTNDTQPVVSNITVEPVVPVETSTPTNIQVHSDTQMQQENNNVVNNVNNVTQIQHELQSVPTVEQGKEAFINNVQSMQQEKKEEKKEGVNFVFIIILFIVLLAAIFFLFPILLDYI